MTRDMDLVRQILLTMEAAPDGYAPNPFQIEGYEDDVVGHHVYLMEQAGLITAIETTANQDPSPNAIPLSISWKGHEFLAATRSSSVWQKVKAEIGKQGGSLPFTLIERLAMKFAAAHLGLPDV